MAQPDYLEQIKQQFGEKYLPLRPETMSPEDYYHRLTQIGFSEKASIKEGIEGKIYLFERMADLDCRFNQRYANKAAERGQIPLLEWLEKRNIIASSEGADAAIKHNRIEVLTWLAERGIHPRPDTRPLPRTWEELHDFIGTADFYQASMADLQRIAVNLGLSDQGTMSDLRQQIKSAFRRRIGIATGRYFMAD